MHGITKALGVGCILLFILFSALAFTLSVQAQTATETVTVGGGPWGVAIAPNGEYAYVTNTNRQGVGTVSVINTGISVAYVECRCGSICYGCV